MRQSIATELDSGQPFGKQAMWEYMRKHRVFTVRQLAEAGQRTLDHVKYYLRSLQRGGFVEAIGLVASPLDSQKKCKQYRLIKDTGIEAPRLRPDGSQFNTARDQMWRTMKLLGAFSCLELALSASTDELVIDREDARNYCQHLKNARYLREITTGRFSLVPAMNSGPQAPMILRTKVVYDPNLKKILWHEEVEP